MKSEGRKLRASLAIKIYDGHSKVKMVGFDGAEAGRALAQTLTELAESDAIFKAAMMAAVGTIYETEDGKKLVEMVIRRVDGKVEGASVH